MDARRALEETPEEREEDEEEAPLKQKKTDVIGFLCFAVLAYIIYSSILISAQDILASTGIPTASIILCFNAPYFAMTLLLPYYIDKLSLMNKAVASSCLFGAGLLLISLIPKPGLRLLGVVVASLGIGTAEIGFLSATSLHQELTIHSFTSGTGIGSVIGTSYISGMTTLLCVNPKTTMLILLVILPLFPVISWAITRSHSPGRGAATARGHDVKFTRIGEESHVQDLHTHLSLKEKFLAARDSLFLAVPLFIGLFADYLMMQGVVTTIAFENSPFDPRDHFQYYTLSFWLGEIIGRSYGLVILTFKPSCTVVTKKTWILTSIIAGNLILLVCASWYRFLPNFWFVAVLVAITGIAEGALYLNTFAVAGKDDHARHKEFSRAFLTVALQGGIVVAGLMGLVVESQLQEHCRVDLHKGKYCFTRLAHGQWNSTSSCLT